jgi:[protein-PII] uridylyltransferase
MNETGLLGRFIPDFGRIVAQMQHNLYHVYTVDEHTIRAIGILSQIENGLLADELPLSTEIMPKLLSRRELYVALFLHDIAKGRGGDHSEVGEGIAKRLCPRFGLPDDATETVAWLVRHHLVMSRFAFKRDCEDPQTVQDFVAVVQSPERLKLLLLLTATDIRAVGPNVWNGWKGQLLRELYHEARAAMATGDPQGRRARRIERAKRQLADALATLPEEPWSPAAIDAYLARHDPRYWLGLPTEEHLRHARIVGRADADRAPLALDFRTDEFHARTEMLLYAADHPGLFMKVAGALALSGVSIVDAHIFTTADGMALDTLGFQDAGTRLAVTDAGRLGRIRENTEKALRGEVWLEKALAGRRSLPKRADVFEVERRVLVDNSASRTHSVIEVNGRDRPGLLFDLAKTLKELGLVIHSAHISTYGERVVDVFYVKDVFGLKIAHRSKIQRVQRQLAEALATA